MLDNGTHTTAIVLIILSIHGYSCSKSTLHSLATGAKLLANLSISHAGHSEYLELKLQELIERSLQDLVDTLTRPPCDITTNSSTSVQVQQGLVECGVGKYAIDCAASYGHCFAQGDSVTLLQCQAELFLNQSRITDY